MSTENIVTLLLIAALYNVVVFCVYWWDKDAARNDLWRVSEATLLGLALLGGSPGAVAAQRLLRHKTRKEPFRSNLASIVSLHGVVIAVAAFVYAFPQTARHLLTLATRLIA
jgi:Predicted membrane protein